MSHNIIRHKVSDAANESPKAKEEPLKESKEKIDIEALIKQNEDLQEQNKNLTVGVRFDTKSKLNIYHIYYFYYLFRTRLEGI